MKLYLIILSCVIGVKSSISNPYNFRNDVEHRGQQQPQQQNPQQPQQIYSLQQKQQQLLPPQQICSLQQKQQQPPQQLLEQSQQQLQQSPPPPLSGVLIPSEKEQDNSPSIVISTVNGQMRCSLVTKKIEVNSVNGVLDWNIHQSVQCQQHAN